MPSPMNDRTYSSLAAFLAHYSALRDAAALSAEERALLSEMSKLLESLGARDLEALNSASDEPAARRHRERAEVKLRRELLARGVIAG